MCQDQIQRDEGLCADPDAGTDLVKNLLQGFAGSSVAETTPRNTSAAFNMANGSDGLE